jgi:mRNA-degrading endonuclease RelE of RelBE toxin-antitoxin system
LPLNFAGGRDQTLQVQLVAGVAAWRLDKQKAQAEILPVAEPFTIKITRGAEADIAWFNAHDRRVILAGLEVHLKHQPMFKTRRVKPIRPNRVAGWELRLGDFRVLYDVDKEQRLVMVHVVGEKHGNRLLVQGEEYKTHESN